MAIERNKDVTAIIQRLQLADDILILQGHVVAALASLPDKHVQMVATSPPYFGLRSYPNTVAEWPEVAYSPMAGLEPLTVPVWTGSLGNEPTPEMYTAHLVMIFREVRRTLRDDGVVWLNLGDSYAGSWGNYAPTGKGGQRGKETERFDRRAYADKSTWRPPTSFAMEGIKPKDLLFIPERVAFALQADGWYARAKPPWLKDNAMPESVEDRPTTAHESIYLLTKNERYFFDAGAVRIPHTSTGVVKPWTDREYDQTFYPEHMCQDGSKGRPSGIAGFANGGRNRRTTDWWNESLDHAITHMNHIKAHGGMLCDEDGTPLALMVNTEPTAEKHFASWPTKLVEPMVLAGSSRQACPTCGAPWKREVERTGAVHKREMAHVPGNVRTKVDSTSWQPATTATDRFSPVCSCEANDGSGKSIVLDIFNGTGKTGKVAVEHGRSYIGIELNPEYIEITKRTLRRAQTRFPFDLLPVATDD